ncbi:hypothetical protein EGW08_000970 [Elysia chlorotica]|uniref:Uncharacterized protein n=1 Tax=Elysia chlorotica TaxID=188477 RepID=A0A3S1BTY2_ELYCH|nr:hypothetical protein EGW08_000970 [Elysia chlorotica]
MAPELSGHVTSMAPELKDHFISMGKSCFSVASQENSNVPSGFFKLVMILHFAGASGSEFQLWKEDNGQQRIGNVHRLVDKATLCHKAATLRGARTRHLGGRGMDWLKSANILPGLLFTWANTAREPPGLNRPVLAAQVSTVPAPGTQQAPKHGTGATGIKSASIGRPSLLLEVQANIFYNDIVYNVAALPLSKTYFPVRICLKKYLTQISE